MQSHGSPRVRLCCDPSSWLRKDLPCRIFIWLCITAFPEVMRWPVTDKCKHAQIAHTGFHSVKALPLLE